MTDIYTKMMENYQNDVVLNKTCIRVGFEARGESNGEVDVHSASEISSRTESCPNRPWYS